MSRRQAPRRLAALRNVVLRNVAFAVTALALVACDGEAPPPWQPPHDARLNMTLTLEERVDPVSGPSTWRRIDMQLLGAWRASGVAELRVEWLELRRQDVDAPVVELVAGETPEDPARLSRRDLAQLGVLSLLRGTELTFRIDPGAGLAAIEGLDETLDAAEPEGGAELDAWVALRRVFDAERWVTQLRAAGMGAVPKRQRDQVSERRRERQLEIPGRGTTSISMTGRMAEESDGSPVLQLKGAFPSEPVFSGEAEEVPDVLGAVLLGSSGAHAETMYLIDASRPLRGNATVRLQFSGGYEVTEFASFTLLVTP